MKRRIISLPDCLDYQLQEVVHKLRIYDLRLSRPHDDGVGVSARKASMNGIIIVAVEQFLKRVMEAKRRGKGKVWSPEP
jgi:hypothetical protein